MATKLGNKNKQTTEINMKRKNIAIAVAGGVVALSLAQTASAQGWIDINNYDVSAGLFLGNVSTSLPLNSYAELLGGTSVGTLAPIVSQTTGGSVIALNNAEIGGTLSANGPGTGTSFDAGAGAVPNVPDLATGTFQFLVWTGGTGAVTAGGAPIGDTSEFVSAIWTEANGLQPVGINTPDAAPLDIPFGAPVFGSTVANVNGNAGFEGLVLAPVPEPATLALAGLGGLASLVALRRKQA